jgi:hypothetical protein
MRSQVWGPLRWLRERISYLHFKYQQRKARRKAKKDDPDIYPLW